VADGGKKKPEPIKEGPFGLKSSQQGQEDGPVDDHQVKHPQKKPLAKYLVINMPPDLTEPSTLWSTGLSPQATAPSKI